MQAGAPDPYEALGVQRDASSAEIKRAYQALALKLHPDKQPDESGGSSGGGRSAAEGRDDAALTFQQLQAAWETLRDEESRRAYDETYRLGVEASEAHLTEVDLDDMEHDEPGAFFIWPCRCSDRFVVRESHLEKQVDTFECDTCALKIRVLYDFAEEEDDEEQRQAEQAAAAAEEGHGGDPEPEPEPAARVADRCDEELTLHL